jgi:hypothetical protein
VDPTGLHLPLYQFKKTTQVTYFNPRQQTELETTYNQEMDQKTKKLNWLIGKKSYLSIDNKLLIYKTVIKPIWTYGLELWGCASKTNIAIIQRAQSKTIRSITNAPWFVSNLTLHKDLKISYVTETIRENST